MARYSWSMAKDQNKKRTAKTNKPKITPKEKKLKKLAQKVKLSLEPAESVDRVV